MTRIGRNETLRAQGTALTNQKNQWEIDMEADKTDLEARLRSSLNGSRQRPQPEAGKVSIKCGKRRGRTEKAKGHATDPDPNESVHPGETPTPLPNGTSPELESRADQMTLRQKLGEVRRRIGYIQKRGYNERHNYNYVAAADIAGTVGDILARTRGGGNSPTGKHHVRTDHSWSCR